MRKLATVLLLLVLCVGTAAAQWNLAQDPAATLTEHTVAQYSVQTTSTGFNVLLKATEGAVTDEIAVFRTGGGGTAYTLVDAAVYDATLVNVSSAAAITIQGEAVIRRGIETGNQVRPTSNLAKTKVWYRENGVTRSMNFEIRWNASGNTTITRLPDDVISGAVN